jgi:hypothetical protein
LEGCGLDLLELDGIRRVVPVNTVLSVLAIAGLPEGLSGSEEALPLNQFLMIKYNELADGQKRQFGIHESY